MCIRMNKVSVFLFVLVSSLSFILTGCGKTDLSDETSEQDSETTCLVQNTEAEAKNNLDNWIGQYAFDEAYSEEGYAPMFMDYDINIYKENDQYYADVVVNGQMTGINLKARLYGSDEWISLVLIGYNPGHKSGLETMENGVLLSLRKQGEDIYTYWGGRDVTELLSDSSYGYFAYYDSVRFFEKIGEEKE